MVLNAAVLVLDFVVYHLVDFGIPHWLTAIRALIMPIEKPIHDALAMIRMQAQTGHRVILRYCKIMGTLVSILTVEA